ncbi:MAG: protein-L-isoaspartate(D-aspartate) O-methyltransferase [Chloroflexota bacterium]
MNKAKLPGGLCFFVSAAILLTGCGSLETSKQSGPSAIQTPSTIPATDVDAFTQARHELVKNHIIGTGITDNDVIRAMSNVPRHEFVPSDYVDQAYEDHALPIGYGQTISQPYVVAWMTELLELQPGEKVLEIGTGSGYQAAILAELGYVDVYTIEIVPELAESAVKRLEDLGYIEVHVTQGDGYYGWAEYAPYDAIIVTAAPDHLPAPLAGQLAEDGRLVIPIGPPGWYQSLWKFVNEEGELKAYNMGGVGFVPFTGPGVEEHQATPTP